MARTDALKFDAGDLEKRGIALGELTGEEASKAIVTSLNTVVQETYLLASERMRAGINLDDPYLRRRTTITQATSQRPVASITVAGTQTQLSAFRPVQQTRQVTWTNARIKGLGKKFGPWPGWTQRRGDAARGIAVDRKADGRSVSVAPGGRTNFGHAFSLPGLADSSGNLLMFTHPKGSRNIRALLGPAAYQLFAYQLDNSTLTDDAAEELAETLAEAVERAVQKATEI